MTRSGSLEKILKDQIQTLATTLQPQTVLAYGSALNQFLDYLHIAFPKVRHLSQLRRDPHICSVGSAGFANRMIPLCPVPLAGDI